MLKSYVNGLVLKRSHLPVYIVG